MVIIGSILLLLANAVTLRREKSIFFNRVAILILLSSNTRIGVFSGLFHSTKTKRSFALFICIEWEKHTSVRTYRIIGYLFKVSLAPFRSRPSFTSRRILPNYSRPILFSGQRAYSTSTKNLSNSLP